jgi:uncharacterized integral membrane protein (TIGR00697 family)
MTLKNDSAPKLMVAEQVYTLLISLFIGLLLLTNVITSKYVQVSGFVFTAGAITYPVMLMIFNLITEIYGKSKAKFAIYLGFLSSILMTGMLSLIPYLTISTTSPFTKQAFEAIVGFTPGVVVGSLVAYITAQLIDVHIFSGLKKLTKGKYLWLRTNVSACISQLLDTVMFATVAWIIFPLLDNTQALHPIEWHTWYIIIRNEYILKIIFSVISIPLVYVSVYGIRRYIKQGERVHRHAVVKL